MSRRPVNVLPLTGEPDPNAAPDVVFETLAEEPNSRARRTTALQRMSATSDTIEDEAELLELDIPENSLTALLMTQLNGDQALIQQKVTVEYLRQESRLRVPKLLGMAVTTATAALTYNVVVPELLTLYWRLTRVTYVQMKTWAQRRTRRAAILTALEGYDGTPQPERYMAWYTAQWASATPEGGLAEQDDMGTVDMVMAALSARLGLNCDIRDAGFLITAEGHTDDGAWRNAASVPLERLHVRIRSYTLQSIAALNLPCVHACQLAAWVRAYGIGVGVFPARESAGVVEYTFTRQHPTPEDRTRVVDYEASFGAHVKTIACNVIAMFGLFHLAKDHTYRPNDPNMTRIGTSYMQTLRTSVDTTIMADMEAHPEAILRTAAHPFGLGQTYWLAQVMGNYGLLATPLAVRLNVTPPPVQRLMIIVAASQEWENMPAGRAISDLYESEIQTVKNAVAVVRQTPPAYSALHNLYGIREEAIISDEVMANVKAVMPAVYGFAYAMHVTEKDEKDGIGLALSLNNVARDSKGLVLLWKMMWDKYVRELDDMRLAEFVQIVREGKENVGILGRET